MNKKKPYVPPRLTEYDPKNIRPDKNPTPTLLICDDNPNIRYLLRAIGVDLTLSKSDNINKLADHLHALLTPDTPNN